MRRVPLNPLFSKRSIVEFEPVILEKVDLLAKRIATFEKTGEAVTLNDAFSAFSGDVITTYCFGDSFDHLKSPGFAENYHAAFEGVRKLAHLGLQFPPVFLVCLYVLRQLTGIIPLCPQTSILFLISD